MPLKPPQIINIPIVHDARGNLCVVEGACTAPFNIKRIFYLCDIPGGSKRGGHAHKKLNQFIIAVNGSFEVSIQGKNFKETYILNRSNFGLYVPPMHWCQLKNFSSGAVCLVLASEHYDESDYIRSFKEFKKEINK
jgi:glyoxylate utilization-related uncharacterized protein